MIPSANSESRERLPPEKRFRKPRIELPEKFDSIDFTALMSTPGDGM